MPRMSVERAERLLQLAAMGVPLVEANRLSHRADLQVHCERPLLPVGGKMWRGLLWPSFFNGTRTAKKKRRTGRKGWMKTNR